MTPLTRYLQGFPFRDRDGRDANRNGGGPGAGNRRRSDGWVAGASVVLHICSAYFDVILFWFIMVIIVVFVFLFFVCTLVLSQKLFFSRMLFVSVVLCV